MFDKYLPTIYENAEWSEAQQDTTSKLLCILCRRELGTKTSQHTCSSRGNKNSQLLVISSKQKKATSDLKA